MTITSTSDKILNQATELPHSDMSTSENSSNNHGTARSLLTLPPEMRWAIYELIFPPLAQGIRDGIDRNFRRRLINRGDENLRMTQVCRQIRDEVQRWAFTRTYFAEPAPIRSAPWLSSTSRHFFDGPIQKRILNLPKETRACIRSLEIGCDTILTIADTNLSALGLTGLEQIVVQVYSDRLVSGSDGTHFRRSKYINLYHWPRLMHWAMRSAFRIKSFRRLLLVFFHDFSEVLRTVARAGLLHKGVIIPAAFHTSTSQSGGADDNHGDQVVTMTAGDMVDLHTLILAGVKGDERRELRVQICTPIYCRDGAWPREGVERTKLYAPPAADCRYTGCLCKVKMLP